MAKYKGAFKASVTPRATMSMRVKHSFSKQHLFAANLFAHEANDIEIANHEVSQVDEGVKSRHRAFVTATVFSAVAFLEAAINELLSAIINLDTTNAPKCDEKVIDLLKNKWKQIDRLPTLSKYKNVLSLLGKPDYDWNQELHTNIQAVIMLRACLVHYRPEWDDEKGKHHELEKLLSGRFELNPFAKTSTLWFPHHCLGAGCASWTVNTVDVFYQEYNELIKLK